MTTAFKRACERLVYAKGASRPRRDPRRSPRVVMVSLRIDDLDALLEVVDASRAIACLAPNLCPTHSGRLCAGCRLKAALARVDEEP